ncbi:MAG: DUF1275 domain-containing protein [Deltaproteobacteria bacterium]|nr:DUF1275 domain-containing protein [Deltaproteobacteria bacterium]
MTALTPILSPREVHGRKQIGIWVTLAFSAGCVNAIALAACQRFVTHVTGTLTLLGTDHTDLWLVLEYACVLGCFVLGAMASVVLIDGRRLRHREPWPLAPLGIVAAILFGTAIAGALNVFGPFGRTVETPGDFVLLSVLGFAMGLQNASIATTTGMIVRTTHMTGPVTDFAVALATALSGGESTVVEAARQSAKIRLWKILAFATGALVGVIAARSFEYGAFLLPSGTTLLAATWLHRSLGEARAMRARRVEPSSPPPVAERADASAE